MDHIGNELNREEESGEIDAILITPSLYDLRLIDIFGEIKHRHGNVHVYVSINDRDPTLYLVREMRAIVGIQALRSTYKRH